jgi:3-phosphoglycerate kinase
MDSIMNNKYALASIGFLLGVYAGVNNPKILNNMTTNSDMIIIVGGLAIIYIAYKNKLENFVGNFMDSLSLKEKFTNVLDSIKSKVSAITLSQAKLDAKCQNEYGKDMDANKIKDTVTYKDYKMMKKNDPRSACSKLG